MLHRDREDGVPTVAYTYVTDNLYTTLDRWASCYTKCDTLATCILLMNENRPSLAQLSKPAYYKIYKCICYEFMLVPLWTTEAGKYCLKYSVIFKLRLWVATRQEEPDIGL